jgi:thiol-disulfide isomerase/thioredoxin
MKIIFPLLLVLLITACSTSKDLPAVNTEAYNFKLPTPSGDTLALADFKAKDKLIVFWATWCVPCIKEIPIFNEMQQKLQDSSFQIISINLDESQHEIVPKAIQKYGIKYPVVYGNEEIVKQYGNFSGLPAAFLVDKNNQIFEMIMGAVPAHVLNEKVQKLRTRL